MKMRLQTRDWLTAAVGIAVVGGSLTAARIHNEFERKASANVEYSVALDRAYFELEVQTALKALRAGEVERAALRLDRLASGGILRTESQLTPGEARARAYVLDTQRAMAQLRQQAQARVSTSTGSQGGAN